MKDQERTPLRVVLRNFLNHIENLESQNCPEKSYDAEFQDLKLFSENVKSLKEYSCLEGEKEINRKKNRYKDILPFDLSRVVLNEYAGIPGSDYINANYIKGASGSPAYIASQGPLPSTVNDFWRMVVQCEVQVIVMACNEEEAGKAKCEKYWVDEGEEKQFGMISVKLLKSSTVCSDFSVRTMRLKYNNSQSTMEERTVCQLHYVAWPDHGVPTVVQPLLDMVRLVRDTQASETLPVLIHCSAGCGRTGTICAIDYVWGLLRTGKLTNNFSLLTLIREMRKQRIAMVQTKEQYVLVHQAVRELFKEQLCMIDSHPYENVDTNGLLIINDDDEEHVYDSIESLSKDIADEKQDYKKEKDIPPPLPKKKQQATFPSKKEKDVENLSAQQRAIHRMPKAVRALRLNETPTQRPYKVPSPLLENLEDTPKRAIKPIPSKGILRVPQLDSIRNSAVGTVKRSKSLKVAGNDDKQRFMVCSELPVESKRRASLESNLEESINFPFHDAQESHSEIYQRQLTPGSITSSTKKYEDLNSADHRKPLVRSYTTLDMRTKVHSEGPVNNFERIVAPAKVKLSRSNTQVDFSKIITSKTHFSKTSAGVVNNVDIRKVNSMKAQIDRKVDTSDKNSSKFGIGKDTTKEQSSYSLDSVLYGTKPFSSHKDITDLRKIKPKKLSPYQSILQKELAKANQTTTRTQIISPLSQVNRSQNYPMPFQPTRSQNKSSPHQVVDQAESFQLDLDKNSKMPYCCDLNGSTSSSANNSFNEPMYGLSPQRSANSSMSFSLDQQIKQQTPIKTLRMGKLTSPDGQINKKFSELTPSEQHARVFMEGNGGLKNQKLIPKSHLKGNDKIELHHDTSLVRTNFPGSSSYNPKELPQKRVEMESSHYDAAIYGRCVNPNAPFTYGRITKRPLQKTNLDESQSRATGKQLLHNGHFLECHYPGNPSPKSLSDHRLSTEMKLIHEPSPSTSSQKWHMGPSLTPHRNPPLPGTSDDIAKVSHGRSVNYFQSAPGVDIDQVAASIPQKESGKSNFMKVALEAFSLRHTKQHWKKDDTGAKTPTKPEVFSRGKKKQQQYL